MAGWHHWLDGRESEWTPGVGDGGLAFCASRGCKQSDTTEWLNWTELNLEIWICLWSGEFLFCVYSLFIHLGCLYSFHMELVLGKYWNPSSETVSECQSHTVHLSVLCFMTWDLLHLVFLIIVSDIGHILSPFMLSPNGRMDTKYLNSRNCLQGIDYIVTEDENHQAWDGEQPS